MNHVMPMVNSLSLIAAFVAGLAGSVHCLAMCGGISGALSFRIRRGGAPSGTAWTHSALHQLGRVASYGIAGGLCAGVMGVVPALAPFKFLGPVLRGAAGVVLIAAAFGVLFKQRPLAGIERMGSRVWIHIAPLTRSLPVGGAAGSVLLGMLWGWLPCGMVYSMLLLASLSGSAAKGAATMVCFGIGTAPAVLSAGLAGVQAFRRDSGRRFRAVCGVVIFISGVLTLIVPASASALTPEESVDQRTRLAMVLDAHPSAGAQAFHQECSRCHGVRAQGDARANVPSLAGQRFAYLVRQLANFAGDERDNRTMHRIATLPWINEPQRWVDLAAFLNDLSPRRDNQQGDGRSTQLGRGIFHEQCASCHGADAGGDTAGFVPSLRHQHFDYLLKQMHKLAEGYRHNVDEDLVLFMRSFDERDMRATADYLSRLKGPGAERKSMRNDGVVVN